MDKRVTSILDEMYDKHKRRRSEAEVYMQQGNTTEDDSTPKKEHPILTTKEGFEGWPVVQDAVNPQYGWVRMPWELIKFMKEEKE